MRESLEKSALRFLSCAAFRCFVVAHLECPDIALVLSQGALRPYHLVQKKTMHARIPGEFRVEGGDKQCALSRRHHSALMLGEHVDAFSRALDPRSTYEDAPESPVGQPAEVKIRLERIDLTTVRIATTSMSITPSGSWSGSASRIVCAIKMAPAQVPTRPSPHHAAGGSRRRNRRCA